MLRLGLCCLFTAAPIRFKSATATTLLRLPRSERLDKTAEICLHNAESLAQALSFCGSHGIGCFRVMSPILPAKTHPEADYDVRDLPEGGRVVQSFQKCGRLARDLGMRLTFHPDQFIVLNSPRPAVVESALAELAYQAEVAGWVGADAINIHVGGAYGDKAEALEAFQKNLRRLPPGVRRLITVENDDRCFTPSDLLPLCASLKIPLVYDVHHHRCLPDGLLVEEATRLAAKTWNREPIVHLSSPLQGRR